MAPRLGTRFTHLTPGCWTLVVAGALGCGSGTSTAPGSASPVAQQSEGEEARVFANPWGCGSDCDDGGQEEQADLPGDFAPSSERRVVSGTLQEGDARLSDRDPNNDDSFYDVVGVDMRVGARIQVWMRSDEVDCYLHLLAPSGRRVADHDDIEESVNINAHIDYTATVAGRFMVFANSYDSGETGAYELEIITSQPD